MKKTGLVIGAGIGAFLIGAGAVAGIGVFIIDKLLKAENEFSFEAQPLLPEYDLHYATDKSDRYGQVIMNKERVELFRKKLREDFNHGAELGALKSI